MARFWSGSLLKVDNASLNEVIAIVDATLIMEGKPQTLTQREIRGVDFTQPNSYHDFDIGFDYDGLDEIEARVHFTRKAKLWFGGVSIIRQPH